MTVSIVVNPELKAYIDPLTPDEYESLERSLLTEGCRDALVLWGDVLVDGHNRFGICEKHGLPFQTVQNTRFQSIDDVHLWMIDQHLGRRSVSDFQRGVLALRKREINTERRRVAFDTPVTEDTPISTEPPSPPLNSREDIARAARLSASQVVLIEKIQKQAEPEIVAALKAGQISLSAAAAVAGLPAAEQKTAALAGSDELKLAAKRVRDAKRKPPAEETPKASAEASTAPTDQVAALEARIQELTIENVNLRMQLKALEAQLVGS